jgi:hypothetical protein
MTAHRQKILARSKHVFAAIPWWDVVASFSLANLVYLRAWGVDLQASSSPESWRVEPGIRTFAALMVNILLLGFCLFLLFRGARRLASAPRGWGRFAQRIVVGMAGWLVAAVLVLHAYVWLSPSTYVARLGGLVYWKTLAAGELAAVFFPIAYWLSWKWLIRPALIFLAVVSPLIAITFAQGVYRILTFDRNYIADRPLASRLSTPASAPHVLWLIFDEWDEDLTFVHRPAGLELPEIDRLRRETFYSDAVASPGPGTIISMPALTIGKRVVSFRRDGPNELDLTLAGGEGTIRWGTYPTIFSEARKAGLNTGILAWTLPYCRVLAGSLTDCNWLTGSDRYGNDTFVETVAHQFRGLAETQFRSPYGQSLEVRGHAWLYHQLLVKSKKIVSELDDNVTLLHLPIPHPPYFYNRRTGRDDYGAMPIRSLLLSGGAGYVDALALVDRCIGELRKTMEAAGTWDSTTILFSADHPYRERPLVDGKPIVWHVPFLVKLAGQDQPFNCTTGFSALVTHDLLLAILRKEISTAGELNTWIVQHKDAFPTD